MSDEKKGFSKEFKYDLQEFLKKHPLQEAQRKGITILVTSLIRQSETKMEKKFNSILDKRSEKVWKITSGIIIAVLAGLILYGILPAK
jgi:menaquinone-dependent protoporphyrinogen IX oxidase